MEWNTFFQIAGVILSSTIVIIQIRNSFQIARTKLNILNYTVQLILE